MLEDWVEDEQTIQDVDMIETRLFDFESDFVADLQCVPMIVRLKLDRCGIKLSLRQWSRFEHSDRDTLVWQPCNTPHEISACRKLILQFIAERGGGEAKELPIHPRPEWTDTRDAPAQVKAQMEALGLAPLPAASWSALPPLLRFVLLKLSRPGHDNENFVPAMREFGLLVA